MTQTSKVPEVGEAAPDFTLADYSGKSYSLHDADRAEPTLLIFFRGTFCPDCRRQIAFLRRNYDQLEHQGVRVVAVAREHPEAARGYFRLEPPPVPFLLDMEYKVLNTYGMIYENDYKPQELGRLMARPSLFAIDRDRMIRWRVIDSQWDNDGSLEKALASLGIKLDKPQTEAE